MGNTLLDIIEAGGVMTMALPDLGPALPEEAQAVLTLTAPAVAEARVASPDIFVRADLTGVLQNHFLYDFYYRIWVIPEIMRVQNPAVGSPIPFHIWNAYPQPVTNALASIIDTGATGLTFDFDVGDQWKAIEYKLVHITITPAAPINIDASFEFHFDHGVGLFFFHADIADFVQMVPDPPVTETWSWLTDIIPARVGLEQRIALRGGPRRGIRYGFLLEDETERRRQYNRWFKSLSTRIVLPYYQYSTKLLLDSASGSSQLYFDQAYTDVRAGEFVLILNEATTTGFLVKLGVLNVDGATTDTPLTFDVSAGWIIAPAFISRLFDRTGFTMKQVTGHIDVQAEALFARTQFSRPGSTAVIEAYDGMPVLHLRPIAVSETPETFDADYEVVDSDTGIEDIFVAWPHPKVVTTRRWTIRRRQNPAEMDWWRDFCDTIKGQREPFLMPTWFTDLVLAEDPVISSPTIRVAAPDYVSLYFPHDTYKRIQLETANGIVWRKALTATDNGDGTATLGLDTPLGGTVEDVTISKISFLNRVRLDSDTVTLTHERIRTQIELPTRTVDV